MGFRLVNILVIANLPLVLAPLSGAASRQLDAIGGADAYAVYAAVVPSTWASVSKDTLLLQRETEGIEAVAGCLFATPTVEPEWEAVEKNLRQENARVRLLQPRLPIAIPYQLIPRSAIAADDA